MAADRVPTLPELVLLALVAQRPGHGHDVGRRLRDRLPASALHRALHRLECEGLLESDRSSAARGDERLYRLTAKGRTVLARGRRDAFHIAALA